MKTYYGLDGIMSLHYPKTDENIKFRLLIERGESFNNHKGKLSVYNGKHVYNLYAE